MDKAIEDISLRGRMAFAIMCAERYALSKKPEGDWEFVFSEFWRIADDIYWDDWADRVIDLLPEYIYELDCYDADEFSWLDEKGFDILKGLYSEMGDDWALLLQDIVDMEEAYAYTSIPGTGQESIKSVDNILGILEKNSLEPPSLDKVKFSSFSERDGRGEPFDKFQLSIILR